MNLPEEIKSVTDLLLILKELKEEIDGNHSSDSKRFTQNIDPLSFPYGIWFRGEGESEEKPEDVSIPRKPLHPKIFRIHKG